MIVDASALDWLAAAHLPKDFIRVLTPHPGEAAQMLNTTAEKVQADRVEALREISQTFWQLLGRFERPPDSHWPREGKIFVNRSGNPHLAQGGSGDLLAGFIAGLLAQPALQADVEKTLCYAVWQHGAAADKLQAARANWVVEDLAGELGGAR